jgi:hypothetical protein
MKKGRKKRAKTKVWLIKFQSLFISSTILNLNYPCAVAVADHKLKRVFDQACIIAMVTFRGLMEIFEDLEGRQ